MVLVWRLSHRQILSVLSLCAWRLSLILLLSVLLMFWRLSCRQLLSMLCLCIWRLGLENYWACHVCVFEGWALGTFWACYIYVFEGQAIGSFWVCGCAIDSYWVFCVFLFQGWSRTGDLFITRCSGPQTKLGRSLQPFQL